MTPSQRGQFNRMRQALKRIANDYESADHLRIHSQVKWGLNYAEALEYSYQNVKAEAANAVKCVRAIAAIAAQGGG